jgi:hypothetical protein
MSTWSKTVTGLSVSLVLDRRSFLTGAGLVAATLAASARPVGYRVLLEPAAAADRPLAASASTDSSVEWAADHIFGTYPPYAHPIPYRRAADGAPVLLEAGSFDPILMI